MSGDAHAPIERGKSAPRRRAPTVLSVALAVCCVLIVASVLWLHIAGGLPRFEGWMAVARPWCQGLQLLGITIVWSRWPQLIDWFARRRWIGATAVKPLLDARHRLMALVLLIQLAGTGWPFSLLKAIAGE